MGRMLGNRIRRTRIRLLLTQEEFAKELGVARHTVARWETDTQEPSLASLRKLRDLFQMNVGPSTL